MPWIPRTWRRELDCTAAELAHKIGGVLFGAKFGPQIPKILVVNDDVDPTNLQELVWAFATRCHPGSGEVYFNSESTSPLVAFLTSAEKYAENSTKVVYNCLPPDDWGENLPKRSSFAGSFPQELQQKVLTNWKAYGFSRP